MPLVAASPCAPAAQKPGDRPTLVWLGGYRSDMTGTKASNWSAMGVAPGTACIRFDYSGHGASGGAFTDGTISRWLEKSLAVVDHAAPSDGADAGRLVDGGWIALRLVQELRVRGESDRVAGLVLIAPAPDFTIDLIEPNLTAEQRLA